MANLLVFKAPSLAQTGLQGRSEGVKQYAKYSDRGVPTCAKCVCTQQVGLRPYPVMHSRLFEEITGTGALREVNKNNG